MTILDILNDDLRREVLNVRKASEKLWTKPIHRYYTDHTVKHSDRIIKYIDGLMSAHLEETQNNSLSKYEIYILLAAAYLHDIGMQFTKAEGNLERLREIHNEKSYDMILYSNDRSKDLPALGLIEDPAIIKSVAEVARAHRRVDIYKYCSSPFTCQGDKIRPQFLGALLRLADALDIDRRRVIWEELKLANIPSESRYHWFRCYYVDGVEVKNQGIRVSYRFPQETKYHELFTPLIQAEIESSIQEVREILFSYGATPILLDGQINFGDNLDKIPTDVYSFVWHESAQLQKSRPMTSELMPIQGLAREVQFWLEVLGYVVEDWEKSNDDSFDLSARKRSGVEDQIIHVRSHDGEIQKRHIKTFESEIDSVGISRGWIVSERRIANSAETYSSPKHKVKVLTLPKLINTIFARYYDYLNELTKGSGIESYYIELACRVPSLDVNGIITRYDSYPDIDKYVDNWLCEDGQAQLSILGDFGTGKTWFCRHYAQYRAKIFIADPVNNRLPLLIRLRDYALFNSIETLITDFLVNKCKIALPNPYEIFQRLNQEGRLLLLFDGFDEMGTKVDDEITKYHFEELAHTVTKGSKVIFTCRREYFQAETQVLDLLAGKRKGVDDDVRPYFDLLYLEELNDEQIKQVLQKRVPKLWKTYWGTIRDVYDLPDLVKRPIMLDMVINAYDDLKDRKSINHTELYEICTNQWIEKDIGENRTLLDAKSKRFFAQEVAWEMFSNRELTIPFKHIRNLVNRYLDSTLEGHGKIEFLEHDIRTASFISKRDARGNYEFVHKSFMEFFAAQKLAEAIKKRNPGPVKQQEVYYEIIRFLYFMLDPEADIRTLVDWLSDREKPEKLRANGIRMAGQWVNEDVLKSIIDIAKNPEEKIPLRRDAIRSIIRMLHGEEVDWIRKEDIINRMSAFAIRTDRSTLDVGLMPIEIKLVHTRVISEERQNLLKKYTTRIVELLKYCLSGDQPVEVRQNASFAFIHFVRKGTLSNLRNCAMADENSTVRFNCCVALIAGGSTTGKKLLEKLISSSSDEEICRLGKENLRSFKKAN